MSEQTVFEHLRKAGMTVAGALGVMGNMKEESGVEACRVQGDFTADRSISKDYASKVDSGVITDDTFAKDGKGWGLVQFTFSGYKRGLLNYCRRNNLSIADEKAQIDYLVAILKQEFSSLFSFLCSASDDQLYTATDRFCREFERPSYNNINVRFKYAKELRDRLQGRAVESIDNGIAKNATTEYWPPRMICKGMFGPDVSALQALLRAHNYTLSDNVGIFGEPTEDAVIKYQADNGLDADGICGPKTWAAITKL